MDRPVSASVAVFMPPLVSGSPIFMRTWFSTCILNPRTQPCVTNRRSKMITMDRQVTVKGGSHSLGQPAPLCEAFPTPGEARTAVRVGRPIMPRELEERTFTFRKTPRENTRHRRCCCADCGWVIGGALPCSFLGNAVRTDDRKANQIHEQRANAGRH